MGSTGDPRGQRDMLRCLWVSNTVELLQSPAQIQRLFLAARDLHVTDLYLSVDPHWWADKADELSTFNEQCHGRDIRVWAVDGERAYIDNIVAEERLMHGLYGLVDFNEDVPPSARFFGFQADIQPQDTPEHPGCFHNDVPMSQLSPEQQIQRDIVLHKWLNVLTRASAYLRSFDLAVSATLPDWLHEHHGEAITVPWVNEKSLATDVVKMVLPLVDQYVVLCSTTDPTTAASRIRIPAEGALSLSRMEGRGPLVFGRFDALPSPHSDIRPNDRNVQLTRQSIVQDLTTVEHSLAGYDAFGGMGIHDWTSWDSLPRHQTKGEVNHSALNDRFEAVLRKLDDLRVPE